jgi:hypothetical protein
MDIYNAALEKLDGYESVLHHGPSHTVWEDENWKDKHIESCLHWLKKDKHIYLERYSQKELDICKWSLEELLKIPYEQRDYEPKDYDGEHPENYPPPEGIEMIRL